MKVRLTPLMLALFVVLSASGPAAAQDKQQSESFVAKVDVTDEAVTFHPEGRYVAFVMQVAGPEDFYLEQGFKGDEAPSLRLKTERGTLVDGSYTIQVTAQPEISEQARAALVKARAEDDRAEMRRIMKEAGLDQRAMIYSMNIGVAEGHFLNPYQEEPADVKTKEGDGASEGLGASDGAPMFGSVRLTGRQWNAAYRPGGLGQYVAAPDVTGTDATNAFLVNDEADAPPFLQASSDPTTSWYEVTFENRADDGSPLAYQGYLRPVSVNGQATLFQAYFREAAPDGADPGPWLRGYFRTEGDGFRFLTHAEVTRPAANPSAPLFDYVAQDDPAAAALPRDFVISDDLIVDGSACIGFDCVNGEPFGFDTLRLKENNLRIHFQDTSTSASFPTFDWRIGVNETSNGGLNKFFVEDTDNGRIPFTIEGSADANSLYVDTGGRIGFGTSTPVVELHVKDGDTPTLRLEQDGSSGFTPQTWDVAGNETNFFIRDVTNGSTLPFRIRPGAPTSAIDVSGTGNVGIGSSSPQGKFHVENTGGQDTDDFIVTTDGQVGIGIVPAQDLHVGPTTNTNAGIRLEASATHQWDFFVNGTSGIFGLSKVGVAGNQATLDASGNLVLQGNCSDAVGGGGCTPDYVFEPDYEMLTLQELEAFVKQNKHLPNVPNAAEIEKNGLSVRSFSYALLEKIEELTLHTIEQQKLILELQARLKALETSKLDR